MRSRNGVLFGALFLLLSVGSAGSSSPTSGADVRDTSAKETTYEGTWRTTNRRLDGRMTCVVRELGDERWNGHFYGVWQGVSFSYRVTFSGPPNKLSGKAEIDGADYAWTGAIKPGAPATFVGSFDGNRYRGDFHLAQKVAK